MGEENLLKNYCRLSRRIPFFGQGIRPPQADAISLEARDGLRPVLRKVLLLGRAEGTARLR